MLVWFARRRENTFYSFQKKHFNFFETTLQLIATQKRLLDMPAGMGLCTYFFQLNQLEQSYL